MRVLVIGGTRFIGRALAHDLAGRGHDVAILHRGDTEPDDLPRAHHIHADRDQIASAHGAIDDFEPDVVCDNIAMFRSHAEGVLAACGDRRFVVVSSCDVYRAYGSVQTGAVTDPDPVNETSPVREQRYPYRGQMPGMDDYDKLDVEEVYLARGATVMRLPMVYGPRDGQRREEFILSRVRAGRTRIPVGAGTWRAGKGFVDDVAHGIALAIEDETHAGEIFNIAESTTYPMVEWAQMILDAAGSSAELVRVSGRVLPPDLGLTGTIPQDLLIDATKARERLGFTDTPATEALQISVAWHLAHPPPDLSVDFSTDDAALSAAN